MNTEVDIFIYEPYRNTGKIGMQLRNSSALDHVYLSVIDPASEINKFLGFERDTVYDINKSNPTISDNPCNMMPISSIVIQSNVVQKIN